jgi:hypothetical protein
LDFLQQRLKLFIATMYVAYEYGSSSHAVFCGRVLTFVQKIVLVWGVFSLLPRYPFPKDFESFGFDSSVFGGGWLAELEGEQGSGFFFHSVPRDDFWVVFVELGG